MNTAIKWTVDKNGCVVAVTKLSTVKHMAVVRAQVAK